ncbi:MAG: tetratricopeptide repeat protein [Holophagales bacterium]|nr:tetratricopeptide repeat protein [Holophagales bacterium]
MTLEFMNRSPIHRRPAAAARPMAVLLAVLLVIPATVSPAAAKKDKKEKGIIEGEVQSQEGESLQDVRVTVTDADTEEKVGESVTNRKGKFEIEIEDPSGEYIVSFAAEGYAPFDGRVELEESRQQILSVKLLDEAAGRANQAIQAYNDGAAAHRSGDLAAALAKFREAAEINPELAPAHLGIADIHLQQGQTEEAVAAVEMFRTLEPDDEQGKKVAYEAYRRAGLSEKAKALAEELGNPDMSAELAIGVYNEGAHASQQGDYETALAKFRQAAELDPGLAQAHSGVASIYYNQSQLDEALAAADQALGVDGENRQGLRIRYLVLDARGELEPAMAAWDAYRALDEDGAVDLLFRRATMDFEAGDTDRAREALAKVLSLRPDFARAHYQLGLVLASTDTAKAKEHLAKFLELAPDDPEAEAAKEIMAHL